MSIATTLFLLLLAGVCLQTTLAVHLGDRVVSAVNCGGTGVLGAHGIYYDSDESIDGTASDHGMQYSFRNGDPEDLEIYQTERWSSESFEYEVAAGNGEYVVILKFSEVYFQKPGEKVFHVKINSHTAVKNLDIFKESGGRGFAHDVYVPIVIKGDTISINGHSKSYDGKIVIEFAKGPNDNPKVNGFAVVRGNLKEMPSRPERFSSEGPLGEDFEIEETDEVEDTYQPQVLRNNEADEEVEMFSAASKEEFNPFDKELQESNEWWLWIVATLICLIPLCYVVHIWQERRGC